MMTDPIADMLTRIRNASRIERPWVDMPATHLKQRIAQVSAERDGARAVERAGALRQDPRVKAASRNRERSREGDADLPEESLRGRQCHERACPIVRRQAESPGASLEVWRRLRAARPALQAAAQGQDRRLMRSVNRISISESPLSRSVGTSGNTPVPPGRLIPAACDRANAS